MIYLLGPTASGKSALAMQLAGEFPCEIVSVDSAQVYRGMDIGTAKPSREERLAVPHHLLDCCDPNHPYSVNEFFQQAQASIQAIQAKGKIPLLVGGSCLYFAALKDGLANLPAADLHLRQRLTEQALQQGWPQLHQQLAVHDPITAARLHPHDGQRIQRALEVWELTGKPLSYWHAEQKNQPPISAGGLWLGLMPEIRADLHKRIAWRFQRMLAEGFDTEVRQLFARNDLHVGLPSIRSVGYRQWWSYLQGQLTAEQAQERAIIATRQLAKRQLTWLRSWPGLTLLPSDDRLIVLSARKCVKAFLQN